MDFDYQYYLQQIQLRDSIKKQKTNLKHLYDKEDSLKRDIRRKNKNISNYKMNLIKLNGIKNFFFNRRKNKSQKEFLKTQIETEEKKLLELEQELDKLNLLIDQLEKIISQQESMYVMELDDGVIIEDNIISINDKASVGNIPVDDSKKVIVHATNFFPKNKTILCTYDGNMGGYREISYQGLTKNTKCISHRHSCHFSINNVVESTGDGLGTWDQPKYIIIEPLDPHKEQFVHINPSDSWTYGSLQLGSNPILLVRKDVYDSIPKEELDNYSVIKYDGSYVKCFRNLLKFCGIENFARNDNYAAHHYSPEYYMERILCYRNLATNYIKDNSWDGKSPIYFDENELFCLYEIIDENFKTRLSGSITQNSYIACSHIEKMYGIPANFTIFMTILGIQKNGDKYTFENDDVVYQKFNNMVNLVSPLEVSNIRHKSDEEYEEFLNNCAEYLLQLYNYNIDELVIIYEKYKKIQQKKELYENLLSGNSYIISSRDEEIVDSNGKCHISLDALEEEESLYLKNEKIWFHLIKRVLDSYQRDLEFYNELGRDERDTLEMMDKRLKKLISIGKKQFNMSDDFIDTVINNLMKDMNILYNTEEFQNNKRL